MCCEEGVGCPEPDSLLSYKILKRFFCPALLDARKDIALRPGYSMFLWYRSSIDLKMIKEQWWKVLGGKPFPVPPSAP